MTTGPWFLDGRRFQVVHTNVRLYWYELTEIEHVGLADENGAPGHPAIPLADLLRSRRAGA